MCPETESYIQNALVVNLGARGLRLPDLSSSGIWSDRVGTRELLETLEAAAVSAQEKYGEEIAKEAGLRLFREYQGNSDGLTDPAEWSRL